MKPEEQRIAIAEACGHEIDYWPDGSGRFSTVKDNCYVDLPDYLNDLNAMHEAEKTLNAEMAYEYHCKLAGMVSATVEFRYAISATAAQRAEAFLKTIGKWKD